VTRSSGEIAGASGASAQPAGVLLLERDDALAAILSQALADEGLSSVRCRSIAEVITHATHQQPPAIAIFDSTDLAGLFAEEHRHTLAMLAHAVRIVLLVDDRSEGQLLAEDLGVAAVVQKPFDLERLAAALSQVSSSPPPASRRGAQVR